MSVRDRGLRDGRVWVQWERLWEREEEEQKRKKTGGRSGIYGRGKRERESGLFGRKQVETPHEEGAAVVGVVGRGNNHPPTQTKHGVHEGSVEDSEQEWQVASGESLSIHCSDYSVMRPMPCCTE